MMLQHPTLYKCKLRHLDEVGSGPVSLLSYRHKGQRHQQQHCTAVNHCMTSAFAPALAHLRLARCLCLLWPGRG